ncbi:MAG TPA: thiamine-phosphate kinase [Pontiella sp.]
MTTLGDLGEHEAIRRLTALLGEHPDVATGPGDDCAVVRIPSASVDQVITTDPLVEGIHFLSNEIPERIGNKAAGRVLSDLAAMGARPMWLLVNIVAPSDQDAVYLERIYAGMNALCSRFGAAIIGGDLAQGPQLELHVFGIGQLPVGTALLRSGARPGDRVFVTGPLGGSLSGRHLDFVPRVEEGLFLRESGLVHALIDLSDGMATDLRHVLDQSGVGAVLEVDSIPKTGTLDGALYDGEDFELLGTVSSDNAEELCVQWEKRFGLSLALIGTVTDEPAVMKLRHPDGQEELLTSGAYEHYRR